MSLDTPTDKPLGHTAAEDWTLLLLATSNRAFSSMQHITLELQLTSEKRNSILLNEGIGKSQHWPSSVASVSHKLSPGHHCQVTCMLSAERGAMLVTLDTLMQQAAMGGTVSTLDVLSTILKHNKKTLKTCSICASSRACGCSQPLRATESCCTHSNYAYISCPDRHGWIRICPSGCHAKLDKREKKTKQLNSCCSGQGTTTRCRVSHP